MWESIFNFIIGIVPAIIWFVLRTLGIGIVSYTGLDVVLDEIKQYIFTTFENLPADLFALLVMSGADVAFKMVLTAFILGYSIRYALGSFRRFAFVPGG